MTDQATRLNRIVHAIVVLERIRQEQTPGRITTRDMGTCVRCGGPTQSGMTIYCTDCVDTILDVFTEGYKGPSPAVWRIMGTEPDNGK